MAKSNDNSLSANSYGLSIAVEGDDLDLVERVVPWLPDGWSRGATSANVDRVYLVHREPSQNVDFDPQYAFSIDGVHKFRSPNFDVFADYFESDVHHYIATYSKNHLFVHAGAVGWNGFAIVIPGRSYAGKSTLTRAFLDAGAEYYSDDYAIVDDAGQIRPFPRNLRMRDQPPSPQRRIDPGDHGWTVGRVPIPIGLVAALRFDKDAGWDVRLNSKGSGVLTLLANTVAARERPVDAMALMSKSVAEAIAIEGTRGEASEAVRLLVEMLEEGAEGFGANSAAIAAELEIS